MPSLVTVVQLAAAITAAILILMCVAGYTRCQVTKPHRLDRSR